MDVGVNHLKNCTVNDKLYFFMIVVLALFFWCLMKFPYNMERDLFLIFLMSFCFFLSMLLGSNITIEKVFFFSAMAFGIVIFVYLMVFFMYTSCDFLGALEHARISIFGYSLLWGLSFFLVSFGKRMYDFFMFLGTYFFE